MNQDYYEPVPPDDLNSTPIKVDSTPVISLPRSVAVLTNIITGIGLLGMPYCFCSGIGSNFLIVVIVASFSMFSFSILIDCAHRTGVYDYPKLILSAFPNKNLQWIPDAIIFIILIGVSVLYLQFSLTLMTDSLSEIPICPKFLLNRWFLTFVIQFVILSPLILLKTMHRLSFVSVVSFILLFFYMFHSIFYFAIEVSHHSFDPNHEIKIFDFHISVLISTFAIQSSSYTCHTNIFPTLVTLYNPTKFRMNLTMFFVIVTATLIYSIGGIFPYFTLFNKITDPVVLVHYEKHVFTTIIKVCYSILLIITVPLLIYACRLSVNNLLFKTDFTPIRYAAIGFSILLFDCLVSILVKEINVMFGFVGGITCPFLVYIIPSIYYIRICGKESKFKWIFSYISIVVGVFFICVGLYESIRSLI